MKYLKSKKEKYSKVLLDWLEQRKDIIKEQSYTKYYTLIKLYIDPLMGDYVYKKINCKHIINFFKNDKISKLSLSTQRTLAYVIKSSIQYGVERKMRKQIDNLEIKIKKPKSKIDYLTKNEQERLEQYLKTKKDIRTIGLLICLYTGIRLGEICGLKWQDIDFGNKSICINRTVQRIKNNDNNCINKTKKIISTPKSDSSRRVIPLPNFLVDLLLEFKSNDEFYVLTNSLSFKDTRVYEKYFENALKKCKIRNLNFHTLRHTFATRGIESGMDIKTLSEILGHSSYRITLDIYVHSTIDQKRLCINNLANYLNSIAEY